MKTFQEFIELVEKYHPPHEPLPGSGVSPYQKSMNAFNRRHNEYLSHPPEKRSMKVLNRSVKHAQALARHVVFGADNPNFRDYSHPDVNVDSDRNHYMTITHPSSKIKFSVTNTGSKTKDGKDVHEVDWTHSHDTSGMSDSQKRRIAKDAADVWTTHVSPRLPYGSVLKNYPVSNYTEDGKEKNARAKLYSRIGGFGPEDPYAQYASVGREPSPKRKNKKRGEIRTKPMNAPEVTHYFDSADHD